MVERKLWFTIRSQTEHMLEVCLMERGGSSSYRALWTEEGWQVELAGLGPFTTAVDREFEYPTLADDGGRFLTRPVRGRGMPKRRRRDKPVQGEKREDQRGSRPERPDRRRDRPDSRRSAFALLR